MIIAVDFDGELTNGHWLNTGEPNTNVFIRGELDERQ